MAKKASFGCCSANFVTKPWCENETFSLLVASVQLNNIFLTNYKLIMRYRFNFFGLYTKNKIFLTLKTKFSLHLSAIAFSTLPFFCFF